MSEFITSCAAEVLVRALYLPWDHEKRSAFPEFGRLFPATQVMYGQLDEAFTPCLQPCTLWRCMETVEVFLLNFYTASQHSVNCKSYTKAAVTPPLEEAYRAR